MTATKRSQRGNSPPHRSVAAAPTKGPSPWVNNTTLTAIFLVVAFLAYGPALRAPFDFDDFDAITTNSTIRQAWPPGRALNPPAVGTPVSGRPVVNYSFALNYAVNRWLGVAQSPATNAPNETIGFHVVNVILHVVAALLLAAIVRQTIRFGRVPETWRESADRIGLVVASVWLLHPLQTEAVNYVTQRTELLVSTCYLATVYAAIRAWYAGSAADGDGHTKSRRVLYWSAVAAVASILGMGSKEVMITVPLMVMLYDRAFSSVNWKTLWGTPARRRLYMVLLATSACSLALIATGSWRSLVGVEGRLAWYEYLYSQAWAIPRYVGLLFWPDTLTFDYGRHPVHGFAGVPGLVGLLIAGVATLAAWRRPQWQWFGFLGAWFFLLLGPSSSVVPVQSEIAAERRVYLAIAAIIVLLVVAVEYARRQLDGDSARAPAWGFSRGARLGIVAAVGVFYFMTCGWTADHIAPLGVPARWSVRLGIGLAGALAAWCVAFSPRRMVRATAIAAVGVAMIGITFQRSAMYADLTARWLDGIAKTPTNGRVYHNLASVELRASPPRAAAADSLLARAMVVDSMYIPARVLRAKVAAAEHRFADATALLEQALRLHPRHAGATEALGAVLLEQQRPDLALPYIKEFAAFRADGESLTRLGLAYLMTRQLDSAITVLKNAAALDSTQIDARRYLGAALIERDRGADALPYLEQAARLDSASGLIFSLLSLSYAQAGRADEATRSAAAAVAKEPDNPIVHVFAGRALHIAGRYSAAAEYFERAVQLNPREPQALARLGIAESAMGNPVVAARLFERALAVAPGYPLALQGLEQLKRRRR